MRITNQYTGAQNKRMGFSAIKILQKRTLAEQHGMEFARKLMLVSHELPNNIKNSKTLQILVQPSSCNKETHIDIYARKFFGKAEKGTSRSSMLSGFRSVNVNARLETLIDDIKNAAFEVRHRVKLKLKQMVF